jgi:hypothetical protein
VPWAPGPRPSQGPGSPAEAVRGPMQGGHQPPPPPPAAPPSQGHARPRAKRVVAAAAAAGSMWEEEGSAAAFSEGVPRIVGCCICTADFGEQDGIFCAADPSVAGRHFFCTECFRQGVVTECAGPMGALQKAFGDPSSSFSASGQLPCFMFPSFCTVAAMEPSVFARTLGARTPALAAYEKAMARVVATGGSKELEPEPEQADEEEGGSSSDGDGEDGVWVERPLERVMSAGGTTAYHGLRGDGLLQLVHAALAAAATVLCPNCGMAVEKDDSCIHMDSCPCGASFCYCCGRFSLRGGEIISSGQPQPQLPGSLQLPRGIPGCPRNPGGGEPGCDSFSTYLESQPHGGWAGAALEGESKGEGARNEFHQAHGLLPEVREGVQRAGRLGRARGDARAAAGRHAHTGEEHLVGRGGDGHAAAGGERGGGGRVQGESFLRVHWVAVPKALRARRVNRWCCTWWAVACCPSAVSRGGCPPPRPLPVPARSARQQRSTR